MKNIVVFSDGTGQEGGTNQNTNVYKLFNIILNRSPRQISFYDRGIGTGWRKLTGNIAGRGFSKNVIECYEFIFQNFEQGDKIYLFGFSRGAATIRSLSGFIHYFGILPKSRGKLIKEAWKIYKYKNNKKRKETAARFISLNSTMWTQIEFLGVWDTVAALGVPNTKIDRIIDWFIPHGFHDFELSESVNHAYHALAIDDVRKTFHPVLFEPLEENMQKNPNRNRSLEQVWFMGMHTDVGGGYTEKELSDIVLEWMVQHAVKHGLHIFNNPKRSIEGRCTPNLNGIMHDARDKLWKKKIFPKKQRVWEEKRYGKAVIHESVSLRTASIDNIEGGGYEPWILKHEPKIEKWTHLSDWKKDSEFENVDNENFLALDGWCIHIKPEQ